MREQMTGGRGGGKCGEGGAEERRYWRGGRGQGQTLQVFFWLTSYIYEKEQRLHVKDGKTSRNFIAQNLLLFIPQAGETRK